MTAASLVQHPLQRTGADQESGFCRDGDPHAGLGHRRGNGGVHGRRRRAVETAALRRRRPHRGGHDGLHHARPRHPEGYRWRLPRYPRRQSDLRVDRGLLRWRSRCAGRQPRRVHQRGADHDGIPERLRCVAAVRPAVRRRRRATIGDRDSALAAPQFRRRRAGHRSVAPPGRPHLRHRRRGSRIVQFPRTLGGLGSDAARSGDPGTYRTTTGSSQSCGRASASTWPTPGSPPSVRNWPLPTRTATPTRASRSNRSAINS